MKIHFDEKHKRLHVTDGVVLTNGESYGIHIAKDSASTKFTLEGIQIINAKLRAPNRRERTLMWLRLLPEMPYVLIPDHDNRAGFCIQTQGNGN